LNKKTVMTARGKKVFVCSFLCLLLVSAVGSRFTYPANAWGPTPIYDKPILTLLNPRDYITIGNQITILFDVAMPQTWASTVDGNYGLWGTIRNVTCTLNQKQILFNDTVYGRDEKPVMVGSTIVFPKNYPISINYSCVVDQISLGLHNLTIYVAADTYCMNWETIIDGYHYPHYYYQDVSANETFSFDVAAPSTPGPTPTPISTPSASQTPEITEAPSPSPSVAEFPNWIVLPLTVAAATMAVWVRKRKER
jgi:hypothetical protein